MNYGAAPDLQLHAIVPLAWARPVGGRLAAGAGDVEVGAKLRLLHQDGWRPQIGIFPIAELPLGDPALGLGAGHLEVLLPLWLQERLGDWTTYGGGGRWLGNPGPGGRGSWFVGWHVERQVTARLSIGAELYHGVTGEDGAPGDTRANLGMVLDLDDLQHLLLSAGRAIGRSAAQAYLAYQLTFGPPG